MYKPILKWIQTYSLVKIYPCIFILKLSYSRNKFIKTCSKEVIPISIAVDTGIFKGYKIRLNLTLDQEKLFFKFSAAAKIVYNKCLEFNQEFYSDYDKSPSLEDYEDFLSSLKETEGFDWLKEVSCEVLRQSYRDLITAFSRFFKGVSDYPKFKSRSAKNLFIKGKIH